MPVYEFKCVRCGKITEKELSIKDDTICIACSHCGMTADRIISKNTFHLKGDGWFNKPKKGE